MKRWAKVGGKRLKVEVIEEYADDKDPRILWTYAQEKSPHGKYAVRVEVEERTEEDLQILRQSPFILVLERSPYLDRPDSGQERLPLD